MNCWNQEKPIVKEIEKGVALRPEYETQLTEGEIKPSEWTHLCSCRFGEGRPCDNNKPEGTKWTGDSYRYDIYTKPVRFSDDAIALRWHNGGGEGWLIDDGYSHRESLLRLIASIPDEGKRWDYAQALWETAHKTAIAADASGRNRIFKAFCAGKLKKRKKGNLVYAEVTP